MSNINSIFKAFQPFIKSLIKEDSKGTVKRELATVISADSDAGTATVRLLSSTDDISQHMTIPNVSGVEFSSGDQAWVDRWSNDGRTFLAVVSLPNTFSDKIT